MTVDKKGNVYITGCFKSKDFEVLGKSDVAQGLDFFLVKIRDGVSQWLNTAKAVSSQTSSYVIGKSIAVDSSYNCYITGLYDKDAKFGKHPVSNTAMRGHAQAVFICKVSEEGKALWAISKANVAYNYSNSAGNSIKSDNKGNIYLTGSWFSGSNHTELIICKYDTAGAFQWEKIYGGQVNDRGREIFLDTASNSYVLGVLTNEETIINGNIYYDVCLLKHSPSGDLIWSKKIMPYFGNEGVLVDLYGNAHFAGTIHKNITGSDYLLNGLIGDSSSIYCRLDSNGDSQGYYKIGRYLKGFRIGSYANSAKIAVGGFSYHSNSIISETPIGRTYFMSLWNFESLITSTREEQKLPGMKIFPNPGKDIINISLNGNLNKLSPTSLRIVNLNSKVMLDHDINDSQKITLNIDKIPPGLYYIQFTDKSNLFISQKLLIE